MANDTLQSLKKVQGELSKHFKDIETLTGCKLTMGRCKYGIGNFTVVLEGIQDGAKSKEADRYEYNRIPLGLPPLNTKLTFAGKEYVITGMNTTGSKVYGVRDGKTWLLPTETVKLYWKLQKGYDKLLDSAPKGNNGYIPEIDKAPRN